MPYPDISSELNSLADKYHYHKPPDAVIHFQDLMRQILQWIWEWLDALTIRVPGPTDSRPVSSVLIIAVVIGGVIALIAAVTVINKKIKNTASEAKSKTRGLASVEKILNSAELKQQAQQQAASNDFKSACRSLYLSLLQLMHEKEIAIFAPAKTNYEYSYLLAKHRDLQAGFKDLANTVELVWFGTKPAGAKDYEECSTLLTKLETEANSIYAQKQKALLQASKEEL